METQNLQQTPLLERRKWRREGKEEQNNHMELNKIQKHKKKGTPSIRLVDF